MVLDEANYGTPPGARERRPVCALADPLGLQVTSVVSAMLMVIFGAGASFDSCPTYRPGAKVPAGDDLNNFQRPPLAIELFEDRPVFAEAIERYPECQPIVPRLRSPRGETLEAALEDLQAKADSYARGVQQLAAVRFLKILTQNLRRGVQLHIVGGPRPVNYDAPGEEIKIRICSALLNNPPSSASVDPGGFTDFILNRRAEQFLGN